MAGKMATGKAENKEGATIKKRRTRVESLVRMISSEAGMTEIEIVKQGIDAPLVKAFLSRNLTDSGFLAEFTGIPRSTIHKRLQSAARFTPGESDRIMTSFRIVDLATRLFEGDREGAMRWLDTPHRLLNGETPRERAQTSSGAAQIERLIGRIEHGNAA